MTMKQNTPSAPRPIDWTAYASQLGALGVLIAICVIFALIEPAFVSSRNIFNVLRQVSTQPAKSMSTWTSRSSSGCQAKL